MLIKLGSQKRIFLFQLLEWMRWMWMVTPNELPGLFLSSQRNPLRSGTEKRCDLIFLIMTGARQTEALSLSFQRRRGGEAITRTETNLNELISSFRNTLSSPVSPNEPDLLEWPSQSLVRSSSRSFLSLFSGREDCLNCYFLLLFYFRPK